MTSNATNRKQHKMRNNETMKSDGNSIALDDLRDE